MCLEALKYCEDRPGSVLEVINYISDDIINQLYPMESPKTEIDQLKEENEILKKKIEEIQKVLMG